MALALKDLICEWQGQICISDQGPVRKHSGRAAVEGLANAALPRQGPGQDWCNSREAPLPSGDKEHAVTGALPELWLRREAAHSSCGLRKRK